MQSLDKALALGHISRHQYNDNMKWRGEYPEGFDNAVNDEELSSEPPDLTGM
jgi:hypothetical protein